MDLYSTARRLARPFHFSSDEREEVLPIAAHGLIGDGFTCALVGADGTIDWMCLPRFDSPSAFAAVLDPIDGGKTSVQPADAPFESLQQYDPDTNVLETLFRVDGKGVVRLTDFMPWHDDPRASILEVHRRIECVEGAVEMSVVFDPRFAYGKDRPRMERHQEGVLAVGSGGERLAAVLSHPTAWQDRAQGGVEARVRLNTGDRAWLVMAWNAPRPEPIAAYRPFEQLRRTRQGWRQWARHIRYEGPWRHHVVRSALCLKLLIYSPCGSMVAAPTASLPEWPEGQRNWDYRFAWTRDTAMSIRAANLIGCRSEAGEFFHFMRDNIDYRDGLQVMYSVDGTPVPEERALDHLRGHLGSKPVRIGNGARDQVQLDTAGALIDAASLYERYGGSLTLRAWRQMRGVIDAVRDQWHQPDNGIWEPRCGLRHNMHSKLMSWVALRRGADLAALFGEHQLQSEWKHEAMKVREDILRNGLDPTGQHFVNAYGDNAPDAALLLLPIHEFLPAEDLRVVETTDWIRRELGHGPFLYRYRVDDGVGGPEGAFILCGFWLAEVLAMSGHISEAQRIFVAHAESSNHLGLLSEEIDPTTHALLGNFPQAFSHLGLINAAHRIDTALRLRDEGSHRAPFFMHT